MKRILAILVVPVAFAIFAVNAISGEGRALTQKDLVTLLEAGVYPSRVADLIEARGITFTPTQNDLSILRHAGGDEVVERAVVAAGRLTSQQELTLPKPQRKNAIHSRGLQNQLRGPSSPALVVHPLPAPPPPAPQITARPTKVLPVAQSTAQNPLPVGTRIDALNWRHYQQYMPAGMISLLGGRYSWQVPADFEMDIAPTASHRSSQTYREATERYSADVRIAKLPDGRRELQNYRGGEPFPNPQPPDKGYKLLADLWYAYVPSLIAGTRDNPLTICSMTLQRYVNCVKLSYVFRQVAYNTDPQSTTEKDDSSKYWYSEWMSIEEPEQLRYTTLLTLYPKDSRLPLEQYTFIPALRRWTRVSLTARCSPVAGTDYTQDDFKREGFNGGIGAFDANFIGHQKMLMLDTTNAASLGDFPSGYYPTIGWPKPSWAKWQLRDVDIVDVRRIPSEQAGYCYGKRVIYEDSESHYALWEDVYDSKLRLWKTGFIAQHYIHSHDLGNVPGAFTSTAWDLRQGHITNTTTRSSGGRDMLAGADVPAEYHDSRAYSTLAGLAEVMK